MVIEEATEYSLATRKTKKRESNWLKELKGKRELPYSTESLRAHDLASITLEHLLFEPAQFGLIYEIYSRCALVEHKLISVFFVKHQHPTSSLREANPPV